MVAMSHDPITNLPPAADPLRDARREQAERLLQEARQGHGEAFGALLQIYRNYLTILATTQFDGRLRRRLNPSDVVQDAMLAAYRDFPKFRGHAEGEFVTWLRQILIRCLHHAVDMHVWAKRRDVRRDVSIENTAISFDHAVVRISQTLADHEPSPTAAIVLADQLAHLRSEYRDVLVLRLLQRLSFKQIAERMNRSPGAVRMIWLRAIRKYKQLFADQPQ